MGAVVTRGQTLAIAAAQPAAFVAPVRTATRLAHPSSDERAHVTDAVSAPRFATYMMHAQGSEQRAWAAYAWNIRASAAMLQILVHVEVALRNAVCRALSEAFGSGWPYAEAFVFTFSEKEQREYVAARITLEGRLKKSALTTPDFVAGQTFVFWESMLVRRYKDRVWDRQFPAAFPGASARDSYRDVRDAAEELRPLRNRIAHHEPLLRANLAQHYCRALQVIHWACPQKAVWVAREWPLSSDLAGPP